MSAIASLPNELLFKIFKEYLLLPNDDLDFHGDMRFILLGVCNKWRKLVVNERLLWTTIDINERCVIPRPLRNGSVNPAAIFFRTLLAFQCARNLPVKLTIDLPSNTKYFGLHHCVLLSHILNRVASRIESLTVSGDSREMHIRALQGLKNRPMPSLRSFTHSAWSASGKVSEEYANKLIPILQYPFEDKNTVMDTVNLWGAALYPNLSYLDINGVPYDLSLLPTTGLREFGFSNMPLDSCPPWLIQDMLSYCSDTLENLWIVTSLDDNDDDAYEDGKNDPVVLTKLKKMFIEYEDPKEVAKLLPFIRAPVLEQLDLSDAFTSYEDDIQVPSTDGMLEAMMNTLALNRIERLKLIGVVFKDEIPLPEREAFLVKGQVSPKDLPMTLRFLASLTSLSLVHLGVTDSERILPLLNYPRAPNFGTDGEALRNDAKQDPSRHLAYLPALECIHLPDAGSTKIDALVQQFVDDRAISIVHEKDLHIVIEQDAVLDSMIRDALL